MSTLPVSTLRQTFSDEFNQFVASPDGSIGWMTSFPYGGNAAYTLDGNKEGEFYSNSTIGVNPFSDINGILNITATPALSPNPLGLPYNSGLITTDKSFSQTYGYFEVNAKLPQGQGLWPAFWMLPASNQYTAELDVFEQLGSNPSTIYSTIHGNINGNWTTNFQAFNVMDTTLGFHQYGVDWEPKVTTYYLDGHVLGSAPTPDSMNSPMFMLLNLAVGGNGSWPGSPNSNTQFPASMQIDYLHAYATQGTNFVRSNLLLFTSTPPPTNSLQTLVVNVSEDAYLGDATFTVSVDGVTQKDLYTTDALKSLGNTQDISMVGNWGTGQHSVSVNFNNDLYGGWGVGDRNLYVNSVTLNGAQDNNTQTLYSNGSANFSVTAPVLVVPSNQTLTLVLAEDAYMGDAQFTVTVDGVSQGQYTENALNKLGQQDTISFTGKWGTQDHTVEINFLNDLYGGSSETDRNLYVKSIDIDGQHATNAPASLMSAGNMSFLIPAFPIPSATKNGDLTVNLSEDAYLGDAKAVIMLDGKQLGSPEFVTALHGQGGSQAFGFPNIVTPGAHDISVSFMNDLYGGSTTQDRNLYLDSASVNGIVIPHSTTSMFSAGTTHIMV